MKNALISIGAGGALLVAASTLRADNELPKRPEFARYEPMMTRSPFAVATVGPARPAESNFGKDLYVANAAHSPTGDLVTVASSTDKNLKLYLTTAEPVDGYSISNIEWSEQVGQTKVTIMKDGEFATIGFNEALLSAGLAANAAAAGALPQPQPVIPTPQAGQQFQGGQAFGGQVPRPGMIKPAPIPTLPSPPARMRPIIPRVPQRETPAPVEDDSVDE